jgi:hypothetical protein
MAVQAVSFEHMIDRLERVTTTQVERPTVDQLSAQAAEIAANNPPSRVLLTCVLGVLTGIGWLVGRSWLVVAGFAAFAGLAVRYGYRRGARVQTQPKTTTRHEKTPVPARDR